MLAFLGLQDPLIITAYVGCLAASALCVIYGLVTWGVGGAEKPKPADKEWAEHEDKIAEDL